MPSVFQVGTILTAGEVMGNAEMQNLRAALAILSTAPVISMSPTGEAEVKTLRAVIL